MVNRHDLHVLPGGRSDSGSALALLSCVPLIFCAFHPPLWAVLSLWALAGVGTAGTADDDARAGS